MRFREKDVPYMTKEWKNAIREKRRFSKLFAKNRTEENWEQKRKWRNEATKLRRKAIKKYRSEKSEHLKSNTSDFYRTFKHFLSTKNKSSGSTPINVKIDGEIVKDQEKVADALAKTSQKWPTTLVERRKSF